MMVSTSTSTVLHADAEHAGLRAAVIIFLIASIFIIFLVLSALWPMIAPARLLDYSFVITCVSSIVLGTTAVWGIEKGLKRVWHSDRSISLEVDGILVRDGTTHYQLSWDGYVNALQWRFVIQGYKRGGRERRVPNKWVCLATQLQEAENRVIVYTYVSPKKAQALLEEYGRELFHEIFPAEVFGKAMTSRYFTLPSQPDKIPAEYLTGKEGSFWLAEQRRWHEGFELSPEDFATFLKEVSHYV